MASIIKTDNIQKVSDDSNIIKKCGSTITIGSCGASVALASGATQTGFGRTGTVDWCTTAKTSPFTAVSGDGYFVNTTSGSVTVTLPSSPSAGDIVAIADYASTFQTNAVTIARNSSKINGSCLNASLSTEGVSVTLVYVDGTRGWKQVNDATENVSGSPNYVAATGGTVLTVGDFKTHVFTADANFIVSNAGKPDGSSTIDYFVVAGGGGGGIVEGGGGGGAGGFRTSNGYGLPAPLISPLATPTSITASATTYPITVGAGGAGGSPPSTDSVSGSPSTFSTITSAGGGRGGRWNSPGDRPGASGGSGGGGSGRTYPVGGAYIAGSGNTPPVSPPQGNDGANATPSTANPDRGGGGGGAGAAGAVTGSNAGAGGVGSFLDDNFMGPTAPSYGEAGPVSNTRFFAGGGGGGKDADSPNGGTAGDGGIGGGGDGGSGDASPRNASAGTANMGSGGGGQGTSSQPGSGAGGSGIVMLRYKFQN
jgi:hypothetical protein